MPTGSIFAAWQPLCMSRRSWVMVTDFKMRVLRLKPEVHILGSSRSIRHTKVEILRLKSYFLHKKETKLSRKINLWKTFFLLEFVIVSRFFWCLSFLLFPSDLNVSLSVYLWATKCLTLKQWEANAERTVCQNPPTKLFMVLQYRTKNLHHVALHSLCTSKQMIPWR